jgi:glycosyltransferase involved in cell wall biosynthesis
MKILQITRSIDPAGGGPIEAVRQFNSHCVGTGHEVEIASLDDPSSTPAESHGAPVRSLGPAALKYGYSRNFIPWLQQNHSRFDAFVINGLWQYHSYASWQVFRRANRPYVVFPHGMLGPYFKQRYPLKHLKKAVYWPWAEHRVLRDAAAVLFTCEQERLHARETFSPYRANERVVTLGTAAPGFNQQELRSAFFERFPELRDKKLAAFVGRMHPVKGCDTLLRAFAAAFTNTADWRLVMVGPDQIGWQSELKELAQSLGIANKVIWLGEQMGKDKWGVLCSSEVLVLPSHHENFSFVVVEALASRVPVLISNQVNIWREVEQDGAGIVESDSVAGTESLFQKWTSLSEAERERMRGHAKRCFEKRFELRIAGDRLLEVLNSVSESGQLLPQFEAAG